MMMIITKKLNTIKSFLNSHLLYKNPAFGMHIPRRNPNIPTQRQDFLESFNIKFLCDNPGTRRYPKKLGRGPGSGKGKFSGRGMKGQKARSGGGVPVTFEGGQTPIQRRLPKYGRVKRNGPREILNYVNLSAIDYFIKKKIINPNQKITIKTLYDVSLVKNVKFGVKVLGRGGQRINYPINIQVTDASKQAIQTIENSGGSVKIVFRTPLKLRQHIEPEKFPLPLRDPITPAWRVRKLVRKEKDRGCQINYPKPKWKIQEQKEQLANPDIVTQNKFVYPVPRISNSQKIRIRKPKLYKKFSFNL